MSSCSAAITGSAIGVDCVSYQDCPSSCCNKGAFSGCGGTNQNPCNYGRPDCLLDPCCEWLPMPDLYCTPRLCVAITALGEAQCEDCGCTPNGPCTTKTCAQVAASNNNPDVCAGCNTCPGNWLIDDSRGDLPWDVTVTGYTRITTPSGYARAGYPGKLVSQSGIRWTPGGIRFKWKPGSLCKFKD